MAFESDWAFLRAALPDLRDYILSNDVYYTLRPVSGARIPQLTIGNLLLSQARLSSLNLQPQQEDELAKIAQGIHQVREEWRANWGMKAGKEFTSRLNLWQQYIRELRGDTQRSGGSYPSEVRARAILRLLTADLTQPLSTSDQEMLTMLDQILRGITKPGPFVWEQELEDGFPAEGFWFLYVQFGG